MSSTITDRLFVYIRLESAPDAAQDAALAALEAAGQPVVRITLTDLHQLGAEMFRWEWPHRSPGLSWVSIPLVSPTSKRARWPPDS